MVLLKVTITLKFSFKKLISLQNKLHYSRARFFQINRNVKLQIQNINISRIGILDTAAEVVWSEGKILEPQYKEGGALAQ